MTHPSVVTLPSDLTPDMIRAVRENGMTSIEDNQEWYSRLGWLVCAWDILKSHQLPMLQPSLTLGLATQRMRAHLGSTGTDNPDVRELLAFAESAILQQGGGTCLPPEFGHPMHVTGQPNE